MADLLVIDDDVEMGDLLADLLRDEGHEVRVGRDEMAFAMFLRDMGLEIPILLLSGALVERLPPHPASSAGVHP